MKPSPNTTKRLAAKRARLARLEGEVERLKAEIESESCEECHGNFDGADYCFSPKHLRVQRIAAVRACARLVEVK